MYFTVNTDFPCTDNGVQFLEDIENCSSYYQCTGGTKKHRNCPNGFEFDSRNDGCVKSSESVCKGEFSILLYHLI